MNEVGGTKSIHENQANVKVISEQPLNNNGVFLTDTLGVFARVFRGYNLKDNYSIFCI